jgi:hypothetical protein
MENYMTLAEYCKGCKIGLSVSEAALHKANLVELCENFGEDVIQLENSDGVMVNGYPQDVLIDYFAA